MDFGDDDSEQFGSSIVSSLDGSFGAYSADKPSLTTSAMAPEHDESVHITRESEGVVHDDEVVTELLPSCTRLNNLLGEFGYVVRFSRTDIDMKSRSLSAFVVDAWAESLVAVCQQLLLTLKEREQIVQSAALRSFSSHKPSVSPSAANSSSTEYEKKFRIAEQQRIVMEEEKIAALKRVKEAETELKKTLKSFDQQIQEYERRMRQKESELERVKQKLVAVSQRERREAESHRQALSNLEVGDISFSSQSSYGSGRNSTEQRKRLSGTTPSKKSPSQSPSLSLPLSRVGGHKQQQQQSGSTAAEIIEALEAQRVELQHTIIDLHAQINDLTSTIKDYENRNRESGTSNDKEGERDRENSTSKGGKSISPSLAPAAAEMVEKIRLQSQRIDELEYRNNSLKQQMDHMEDVNSQLRRRCQELRDELENLRLELDNRPTMKQWTQKQREVMDLEDKLHDIVMLRGESAEIAAWRQHLSTKERIRVDKRNYELGLWLLDSLPKTVAKEILQSVCRELDISDVSEITNCIVKLKTVVQTVPKMERFIASVCSFLFSRDREVQQSIDEHNKQLRGGRVPGVTEYKPNMEEALPVLKRWWNGVQRCEQLEVFTNRVFGELRRREKLLVSVKHHNLKAESNESATGNDEDSEAEGLFDNRLLWAQRDMDKAVELLRDMCDFQAEVLLHNKSFISAERYIRERPEELMSRLLAHLQYLFQVPTLQGLLPRMNQVYLFYEEMKNFLSVMKDSLGLAAATPDTVLLAEIQTVIARQPAGR